MRIGLWLGWETADQLAKKDRGLSSEKTTQEVPWNMFYWFFMPMFDKKWKKQESKVQTPHRRGSF